MGNRTLTITADGSVCMVEPNGWEIRYAHIKAPPHAIAAALKHARNCGAVIVDERQASVAPSKS